MGKKSRRGNSEGGLSITSLMDIMTIILVFLLKSFGADDISVAPSEDLKIPVSTSMAKPKTAVNVVVSQKDIVVDGELILQLEKKVDENTGQQVAAVPESQKKGQMISRLYDKLLDKAEIAKDLGDRSGNDDHEFKGEILLQCDKRLPFSVVREVMFTAGQAQFGQFRFVVIKGSE